MAGRTLYCAKCGHGITVDRDVPAVCPNKACGSSTWRSAKDPGHAYKLTAQDKAFLKTNRIDPDA